MSVLKINLTTGTYKQKKVNIQSLVFWTLIYILNTVYCKYKCIYRSEM